MKRACGGIGGGEDAFDWAYYLRVVASKILPRPMATSKLSRYHFCRAYHCSQQCLNTLWTGRWRAAAGGSGRHRASPRRNENEGEENIRRGGVASARMLRRIVAGASATAPWRANTGSCTERMGEGGSAQVAWRRCQYAIKRTVIMVNGRASWRLMARIDTYLRNSHRISA